MESLWFYSRSGQQIGPVSFEELKQLVSRGEVQPTDLVRQQGSPNWLPASQVPDLLPPQPSSAAQATVIGPPPLPEDAPIPVQAQPFDSYLERRAPEPIPVEIDDAPRERTRERNRDRDRGDDRRDRDDWEDDDRDRPRRGRRSANDPLEPIIIHLNRAFSWNLETVQPTPTEKRELDRAGLTDPAAQRYAVWRRSMCFVVVLPTFLAALFALIDSFNSEMLSSLGKILSFVRVVSLFALPVTALIAALNYTRLQLSFQLLAYGWVSAFVIPIIIAFTPLTWLLDSKLMPSEARGVFGLLFGLAFFLTLLPSILSLVPAASRASLRMKTLMPTSIIPGWILLVSAPFSLLISLAVFTLIYHMASNILLIVGVVLFMGGPLMHLLNYRLFITPMTRKAQFDKAAQSRVLVLITSTIGMICLIIYPFTTQIVGIGESKKDLMGFSKSSSLLRPWSLDVWKFWIDYFGRSMLTTILFADLIMRMTLSIWKQTRLFASTPEGAEHDRSMTVLESSFENRVPPSSGRRRYDDEEDFQEEDRTEVVDRKRDDDREERRRRSERDDDDGERRRREEKDERDPERRRGYRDSDRDLR